MKKKKKSSAWIIFLVLSVLATTVALIFVFQQEEEPIGLKVFVIKDDLKPLSIIGGSLGTDIIFQITITNTFSEPVEFSLASANTTNVGVPWGEPDLFYNSIPTVSEVILSGQSTTWTTTSIQTSSFESIDDTTFNVCIKGDAGMFGEETRCASLDVPIQPDDLTEYYTANSDFRTASLLRTPNRGFSQTFTIGTVGNNENFESSAIMLYIRRIGNVGMLNIEIQGVENGFPDGNILSSATIDGNTLPIRTSLHRPEDWTTISMSPYTLQSSTQYALVLRTSGTNNDNYLLWTFGPDEYTGGGAVLETTSPDPSWFVFTPSGSPADFLFGILKTGEPSGNNVKFRTYDLAYQADNSVVYGIACDGSDLEQYGRTNGACTEHLCSDTDQELNVISNSGTTKFWVRDAENVCICEDGATSGYARRYNTGDPDAGNVDPSGVSIDTNFEVPC